jgi:hypothetical protein
MAGWKGRIRDERGKGDAFMSVKLNSRQYEVQA